MLHSGEVCGYDFWIPKLLGPISYTSVRAGYAFLLVPFLLTRLAELTPTPFHSSRLAPFSLFHTLSSSSFSFTPASSLFLKFVLCIDLDNIAAQRGPLAGQPVHLFVKAITEVREHRHSQERA